MKRISEILSTHRHAIIWTACYIMVMWTILYFLFRFNMFSGHMWNRLFHAQLHGFAGFVFGILILAALPLYIASTALIVRTKKPLITIPKNPLTKLTNRLQPVPVQSDTPTDTTEKSPAPETANQKPSAQRLGNTR